MFHLINQSPEGQRKMKTILTTLIAFGILAFGTTASAALITINDGGVFNNTVVGDVDVFIAAADKHDLPKDQSGNEVDETAWVNSILRPNATVTFEVKNDGVTYYSTDATDTFAFSFLDSDPRPDYFLVKNAHFQALFENKAYVGWGVFDINVITLDMNLGEWDVNEGFTISHVDEFISTGDKGLCNPIDDPTCLPAVPIPAAAWLFGSGLIGLVGIGRRKA